MCQQNAYKYLHFRQNELILNNSVLEKSLWKNNSGLMSSVAT